MDILSTFKDLLAKSANKHLQIQKAIQSGNDFKISLGDGYDVYNLLLRNNGDVIMADDKVKIGNVNDSEELVAKLAESKLFEIYSDNDLKRGDNLKQNFVGIEFQGDYRKLALAIKKLVRLKGQTNDVNFKNKIDQIINLLDEKEELEEMSATGSGDGAAGFSGGTGEGVATKNAFKKSSKLFTKSLSEIKIDNRNSLEYNLETDVKDFRTKKIGKKEPEDIQESLVGFSSILQEMTYHRFKNEAATRTKSQQLHRGIKEVHKKLKEINTILEYTSRMRTELNEGGKVQYSRFTEKAIKSINEMAVQLYGKIKELKK